MTSGGELRELRQQLANASTPAERRDITARMLARVQFDWTQLFERLANEQNPERMLLMLAELDQIFESRKN